MLAQLSVLALALAPLASALTLQIPVDWHSSSQVNVSWANTPTDPPFSLQLVNTNEFHDTFAIANNLNPSADFASFQLGVIPEGQYTLRAINVTNAGQIYDETPSFTIQAPLSTSSSSSATSSAAASSSGSATASVTGSNTLTVPASSSTSGFGVTVSATSTPSGSGSSGSSTASATDSSGSVVPSSFNGNNGAASLPRLTPWAVAALGVVAGAAAVL
ncbi:hypothetical protein BN946_scf185007.g171 [Trametes cinnabarina]|uniref:Ser-Thr-rich glycosyl-phosphatidyl-inositol-anchored membrane family-domain-containing protein n=1 Tax=Pycnoporus cinnabarinus TaxID=5643 RepID=A0A060SF12_PYCCI|nr:hypothetical protein BN946_scf185007.g171 [Trametes cinnabarina]